MIYILPFFVVFLLFLIITPGKLLNKPYVYTFETLIPQYQKQFSKTKQVDGKDVETNLFVKFLGLFMKMLGCLFCMCHWTTFFSLVLIYSLGIAEFDLWLFAKNFVYSGVVTTYIFRALMR